MARARSRSTVLKVVGDSGAPLGREFDGLMYY
jgi:hypothetical protein